MMNIGYIGMSHLGLNMAVGTVLKGFRVFCYDLNKEIISNLKKNKIHIDEPKLHEYIKKKKKNLFFTHKIDELNSCELVFVSIDIDTDENGNSNFRMLKNLLTIADKSLKKEIPLILMSQVFPGFSKKLNLEREYYYQVETLIFGQAIKRATHPERIIVGSKNEKVSTKYSYFLKKFTNNIILMNYQTAELCKIAINCFLISTVTTTNLLAEICEKIDANWNKISESLKLDKRIGKYAYLKPGMGISGGNLERDLTTISNLSKQIGSYEKVFNNWNENSHYRKNWVFEKLQKNILTKKKNPIITIWGLAYKEDTHSIKNSPSISLLLKILKYKFILYDPIVKEIELKGSTFYSKNNLSESLINSDVLCIMNSSNVFKKVDYKLFEKIKCKMIIDPLSVLNKKFLSSELTYITMGNK